MFILLNALIWFAFGLIIAANAHPAIRDEPLVTGIMAALGFVTAGMLLVLFVFLRKRSLVAYFLALPLLSGISLLTITDEFGIFDFAVLSINIIPLFLLIKDRAWYLQEKSGAVWSE